MEFVPAGELFTKSAGAVTMRSLRALNAFARARTALTRAVVVVAGEWMNRAIPTFVSNCGHLVDI
jgi:hypothetical protein